MAGADNPIGVMCFWKVAYQDDSKQKRVLRVLDYWAKQQAPPGLLADNAAATLRFFVPTFKHPRFAAEREWRLIFTPSATSDIRPRFRVGRGLLVPYLKLSEIAAKVPFAQPLAANSGWFVVKSVCIGPGPYKDINALSAKILLSRATDSRRRTSQSLGYRFGDEGSLGQPRPGPGWFRSRRSFRARQALDARARSAPLHERARKAERGELFRRG